MITTPSTASSSPPRQSAVATEGYSRTRCFFAISTPMSSFASLAEVDGDHRAARLLEVVGELLPLQELGEQRQSPWLMGP